MRRYLDIILTTVIVAVLAAGTVVEKFHGSEYATTHIYGAWWFFLLMSLVVLYAVVAIVHQRLWHVPHKLLLYSSAILILAGGALTAWTGKHGSVVLHPDLPVCSYTTDKGTIMSLPFTLTLRSFEVVSYPGTRTSMDFVSHVTVSDRSTSECSDEDISMNNILRRGGFRLYQEDYDAEGNSTLSVSHDPWGIGVTYAGYVVMFLGIIMYFVFRRCGHYRRYNTGIPAVVIALFIMLVSFGSASAAPSTLPRATADKMGQMYVLYKGRVCPLQTLAKDFVTKLHGSARYEGLTPEQVFSGWIFYFGEWVDEPFIKVKGGDVKLVLGIDGRYASYADFMAHQDAFQNGAAPMGMMSGEAMKPSLMSKNMRAAGEKQSLVQMLLAGKFVKLFPVQDSAGLMSWYAQDDDLPFAVPDDEYFFIRKQLSYCQELVVKGDYTELENVFEKTRQYQIKNAGDVLPSKFKFGSERLYNRLTTGKWFAMTALMLGIVSFMMILLIRRRLFLRCVFRVSYVAVFVITMFLLLIFVLRWIAGGHIPMSGGFDSMNLMSIAIGLLVIIPTTILNSKFKIHYSKFTIPSIALLAIGFCQLVAMMSGSNPPVTHLMPVLSSPLLTLHVTVIMISYALFFFLALSGLVQLVMCRKQGTDNLYGRSGLCANLLPPAVSLLAIGIVIGALWANISWGNYWSWDPKEVWALITLIVYLVPLVHPMKERSFNIYCVLAFLCVIITYFGVNLILGGIHAYN